MVIKNQDGSIFRLRSPNPLMKGQEEGTPLLYNFDPPEEFVSSPVYEDLLDVPSEEIKVGIKETPVDPKIIAKYNKKQQKKSQTIDIPKKLFHCLPAEINKSEDALYGDVRETITYRDKFTFQGILAEYTDSSISIWTNSVDVPESSIIFLPESKRWWKVMSKTDRGGGILMACLLSDFNPSFD